jgi:hypothetical protein
MQWIQRTTNTLKIQSTGRPRDYNFYPRNLFGTKKSPTFKPTPSKRMKMVVDPTEISSTPTTPPLINTPPVKRTIEMPNRENSGKPFVMDVTGLPVPQAPGEVNIPYIKIGLDDVFSRIKEDNALDISVVDLRGRVTWADFLVSATTKSTRHMRGMSEKIIKWV